MGGTILKKTLLICLAALLVSLCACTSSGMNSTGRENATGPDGQYVAPNGDTAQDHDGKDLGDDIQEGLDDAREGLDDFVDDVTGDREDHGGRTENDEAGSRGYTNGRTNAEGNTGGNANASGRGNSSSNGRGNAGAPSTGGGTAPGSGR